MSLTLRLRPRDNTQQPSLPTSSSRMRLLVLAVAVVLLWSYAWLRQTSARDLAPSLALGVAGALALAVLAYVVVRGRRSRALASAPDLLATAPNTALEEIVVESEYDEVVLEVEMQPAPIRVLQLHVRTLETALEEQTAALHRSHAVLAEINARGSDLDRVLLTVKGLRERVRGNPDGESVLNRVEAAVSRLSATRTPARPALATPVTGAATALPPSMNRLILAAPASDAASALPAASEPTPVDEHTPVPPEQEGSADHEPDEPPEQPVSAQRVLPVPAPPVEVEVRGRRWRRRGAA